MNLKKVFEYALQREKAGRDFFSQHAQKAQHAAARGVFELLAQEEEKHIRYIEGQLRALGQSKQAQPENQPDDDVSAPFSERAKIEALDQTVLEAMTPDVAILRVAYLIEKDFVEFYQNMAKKSEGAALVAFSTLANWEQEHAQLFKRLHDIIFKEYTQMPWGG